jgi:phosphinothricin acetyltransferase
MSGDVVIRPATVDDVAGVTDIYNHYVEQTPATFDLTPFSVDARLAWFGHYGDQGRHRLLVAASAAEIVGYATSSRFRDKAAYDTSVEVSVYLHPDALGGGIGSRLYTELFLALKGEDVHRAYAGIALPNDASIALHRRFGFTDVGTYREVGRKFGRYWDVLWMERPLPLD